jgi:hypothetical protein
MYQHPSKIDRTYAHFVQQESLKYTEMYKRSNRISI